MTRWVRSGNTQKHKKMPGDATKWGEFDHQKANKSGPNFKRSNKSLCLNSNFPKRENIDTVENREQFSKQEKKHFSRKAKKSLKKNRLNISVVDAGNSHEICSDAVTANATQDNKLNSCPAKRNNLSDSVLEKSSKEQASVAPKKRKKNKKRNIKGDSKNSRANAKQTETSAKVFEKKKEMFLKKLQDKRTKKGIMLLPSKVERKLYILKKKLREKGVPPDVLKEIIRRERRKEELKFRKTFNPSKLCFHCREAGHLFADCPKKLGSGSSTQETGMCFKCGSSEHTSFKCPKKVQGFPFAKCFICNEQGHISKDCPRNKHGIYPKGGRCNLCGNVNHLKKDCPSLSKKETAESTITLHTINEATSIDAEVMEKREIKKESVQKPKIVMF